MREWIVIESGAGGAAWNMAVDEALLECFKDGDMPILRLYGWRSSLSLGKFSSLEKSVDTQKLKERSVRYARRISGGGILVHDDDISYSITAPRGFLHGMSPKESYRRICSFLICMYAKMGLAADFASGQGYKSMPSDVCLAGREPYDIVMDGKKIGGNAQRYAKEKFFQHGSIPLSIDKERFEPLFLEDSGLGGCTTLRELGISQTREEIKELLLESFCESFGVMLRQSALSQEQKSFAEELMKRKYAQGEGL